MAKDPDIHIGQTAVQGHWPALAIAEEAQLTKDTSLLCPGCKSTQV